MITIFAEKPDVGTKIAAALDAIVLESGKRVSFDDLSYYEKQIKALRAKQGYFRIKYLNQDAAVTWGYGHMCELKQAYDYNESYKQWSNIPLPYIPKSYELKLMDDGNQQYQIIKQFFVSSDLIICATDNDREGDLIFDYIYRYMQCKVPFKRAIFNKQAKEEYQKAFAPHNLVEEKSRRPVIEAGRARSAGDFVVGAGPTVALTLKNPGSKVLSVGRVQTATLNMIVQRELEIQNFKPKDYYIVKGLFQAGANLVDYPEVKNSYIGIHSSKRFSEKEDAKELFNKLTSTDKIGIISEYKTKQYKKGKPHLYSLDTLQMDANKAYGFSLDHTSKLAQSLYDKGYITYPRTDAVHLTNDMVPEMAEVLRNLFLNPLYSNYVTSSQPDGKDKHYFDSSKVESHYAIVPTTKPANHLRGEEQQLYHLIVLVTICMVYPDATMSRTEIVTDVHGEKFNTNGTSIVNPGFYQVLGTPEERLLPTLSRGDAVESKFEIDEKKTEPPKRYTAASLLSAMLNCGRTIEDDELKKLMANGPSGKPRGLGRPSSRASIVSTLEKREYIKTKGKTICPTDRGMSMISRFPVKDLKSADMTAQWEKRLDDIEKGTDTYDSFMNDLENSVRKWTNEILNSNTAIEEQKSIPCPICGLPMQKYEWGYSCSGRINKTCDFAIGKIIASKQIPERQLHKLFQTGRTEVINGFKGKNGGTYSCALVVNREAKKIEFQFDNPVSAFNCPLCGKKLIQTKWGYGCSGYRESGCKFNIGTVARKKLTNPQVQSLLEGKTVFVKGLTSSKGSKFDANLILNTDGERKGQISFLFDNKVSR